MDPHPISLMKEVNRHPEQSCRRLASVLGLVALGLGWPLLSQADSCPLEGGGRVQVGKGLILAVN